MTTTIDKLIAAEPNGSLPTGAWKEAGPPGHRWVELRTTHAYVTLEPRPRYCNRGRWIAKASADGLHVHLDGADLFPRYFFSLTRGLLEIEEWLRAVGETIPTT